MQATRAKLPRHATDTDDEGEMADADNGMAKARQQTLPHRHGHFATHQMVVTGSLCEIGEHQSGAHPELFSRWSPWPPPFAVLSDCREFAAPAISRRRLES